MFFFLFLPFLRALRVVCFFLFPRLLKQILVKLTLAGRPRGVSNVWCLKQSP